MEDDVAQCDVPLQLLSEFQGHSPLLPPGPPVLLVAVVVIEDEAKGVEGRKCVGHGVHIDGWDVFL